MHRTPIRNGDGGEWPCGCVNTHIIEWRVLALKGGFMYRAHRTTRGECGRVVLIGDVWPQTMQQQQQQQRATHHSLSPRDSAANKPSLN